MPKLGENAGRFAGEVARLLKERRKKSGLSKLALAQRAGLDQRTITFIEEGVNVPSIGTLHVICEALGIKTGWLVSMADRAARE